MVDLHTTIRSYLILSSDLTDLVGTRIYAGRDVPPVGYVPADGDCIVFKVRGGGPDYDDALLNPSVQFKCYSTGEVDAYNLYRTLYDHLHNGKSSMILHAESETLGQILEEPETEWYFVLSYFTVTIRR